VQNGANFLAHPVQPKLAHVGSLYVPYGASSWCNEDWSLPSVEPSTQAVQSPS